MDPVLVLQERWWMIAIIIVTLIVYVSSMDFRRFLAIIGMGVVFQIMWEMTTTGTMYPFASLHYVVNPDLEFYIFTVPWSAVFLKSIIYASSSYLITTASGLKIIEGRVDLVKDRGSKVGQHVMVGCIASVTYTLTTVVVEPILANGDKWFLGYYEYFDLPLYFGVDPWYFLGVLVSSMTTFISIAIMESRIGFPSAEPVLFNYEEEKQGASKRHVAAFVVHAMALVIPSFLGLLIDSMLGVINFLVLIPSIYIFLIISSSLATKIDTRQVNDFCEKNPGSFLCKSSSIPG